MTEKKEESKAEKIERELRELTDKLTGKLTAEEALDIKRQLVKLYTTSMYDIQELRKAVENRIGGFERRGGEAHKAMAAEMRALIANSLNRLEMEMERRVAKAVEDMPIMAWLRKVNGIGPRYSGSLAAIVIDIARFRTISALWAYCGMHVIPVCSECGKIAYFGSERIRFNMKQATRRWRIYTTSKKYEEAVKKGTAKDEEDFKSEWMEKTDLKLCQHTEGEFLIENVAPQRKYFAGLLLDHNPFAKSTAWKIAGQFVRQGKFYRDIYALQKARYEERDKGKISDGQLDLRARRAMIKLFLSHLWEMWRKSEGLPAGKPWLMAQRGMDFRTHKYIPPPYEGMFKNVTPVEEVEEAEEKAAG